MKRAYSWIVAIACLFLFVACTDDPVDYHNPDVKLFVKHLKAGTYHTTNAEGVIDVPLFTRQHIPELLRYTTDLAEIPFFPTSSINSQFGGKPRLGECLLWIIESIRLGYPASLGCKLLHKNAESYDGIYFLTNEQLLEAVNLYADWWNKIEDPQIGWTLGLSINDPLKESNYRWW
ncbi:DUF4943 domain-containing protein [Bacteroides sp. 214]|uniref:DUF4943 family protein n=1 Tax=Bacteroides sp. 214 TaxID=2302935 RepID=UPI0013D418B1|nr:DUF4943 family protein [Bacteroides sp. 214]NDW13747.1 DUF4943 domain-containing protein [Bacteroides sp. 214]